MFGAITICAVVAVSDNGIIGRDGAMPWQLSSDLKRFKALTLGKPVIMGRKTFDSIGKPLPGRANFVVTRSAFSHFGVESCPSIASALEAAANWCRTNHCNEMSIIGGGEIFRETLAITDILYVTHVHGEIAGDTIFPLIRQGRLPKEWELTDRQEIPAGERDSHATSFATYRRVA